MKTNLITLILAAAGTLPVAALNLAGAPSTTTFNPGEVWPVAAINSPGVLGAADRGVAMFDAANPVGVIDQIRSALSGRTVSLTAAERSQLNELLAISGILTSTPGAEEQVHAWIKRNMTSAHRADMALLAADLLLENGTTDEALKAYEAIEIDALSPALRPGYIYHRAYANLRMGSLDAAMAGFTDPELLANKEYAAAARFYQGYILYVRRDYNGAREVFENINQAGRPGSMALYYLAQIAYYDGKFDNSLRMARQLLTRRDVPETYTAEANRIAGESLYQRGDMAGAIPYLKKYLAATEYPELSARYILGVAQYAEGDYRAAINNLTPVSAEDSAMGQSAYLYIGQALTKEGDDDGAIMAFNRALNMNHDAAVAEAAFYNYAVARSRGGNVPFASSVTIFEEFLQRYPNSVHADDVARYIVEGYLTQGNYDAALASIAKVKNPSAAILSAKQKVLYTLGSRKLAAGQAKEALQLLSDAEKLAQYDAETARENRLALGEALYQTGQYEQAAFYLLGYLDQTDKGALNRPVALYDLGYTRMAQKQWDKAATNFERLLAAPGELEDAALADAASRLGDARYYQRQWAAAAEAYDKAYAYNPSAGDYPLYQKAVMQGYARNYDGKLATLRGFENLFPGSALMPDALLEQAEAYVQLRDTERAHDVYRRLISDYGSTGQGRRAALYLASDMASAGDTDGAIAAYQELIASAPASDEARKADDAVKRLHAERGTLGNYSQFVAGIDGAPSMDATEAETLAWNAADLAYNDGKGTKLLKTYVDNYPTGQHAAQALGILLDEADEAGNDEVAYRYASLLVAGFPSAAETEYALLVKADIDFESGRDMDALRAWEQLDRTASTAENRAEARMGIMRVSRNMADADRLLEVSTELLKSSGLGSDDKTEASFSQAYAYELKGDNDRAVQIWSDIAANTDSEYGAKAAVYAATNLLEHGDAKRAATTAEAFVNSGTPWPYWLARGFIVLSDSYKALGRDFEAREYIKALKENYPGNEPDIFEMIDSRL